MRLPFPNVFSLASVLAVAAGLALASALSRADEDVPHVVLPTGTVVPVVDVIDEYTGVVKLDMMKCCNCHTQQCEGMGVRRESAVIVNAATSNRLFTGQ